MASGGASTSGGVSTSGGASTSGGPSTSGGTSTSCGGIGRRSVSRGRGSASTVEVEEMPVEVRKCNLHCC